MTISRVPSIFLLRPFNHVTKCSHISQRTMPLDWRISPQLLFVSSFRGLQLCGALHIRTQSEAAFHDNYEECREQIYSSYFEEETSAKQIHFYEFADEETLEKAHRESQRRKRIGLANKGKVPWNKGKKHSAETRERIRQRTKEALSDPKVKKRMSERPRTQSKKTKARISASLRRLWGGRLKWKRSREQFISSWAQSIAEAAKKGGHGQQELDWDSYDKIKSEIALQQLQWAADKAKAKEMARIRADILAKARAEKMEKLALLKQIAQLNGLAKKKTTKRSKEEKEKLALDRDVKLKERLVKIRRKGSLNGQLSQDHRAWEKIDLEFLERDRRRKEVSLADQIREAKTKKAGLEESSDSFAL